MALHLGGISHQPSRLRSAGEGLLETLSTAILHLTNTYLGCPQRGTTPDSHPLFVHIFWGEDEAEEIFFHRVYSNHTLTLGCTGIFRINSITPMRKRYWKKKKKKKREVKILWQDYKP